MLLLIRFFDKIFRSLSFIKYLDKVLFRSLIKTIFRSFIKVATLKRYFLDLSLRNLDKVLFRSLIKTIFRSFIKVP